MPVRTLVTLGVAAAGSFRGNPDGSARTPRRPCRHAPHEDRARFLPVIFLPLCPCTPMSKAAGAAPHGVPATRAGRPEGVPATRAGRPLRGAERASRLADSGQGCGRWAERRRGRARLWAERSMEFPRRALVAPRGSQRRARVARGARPNSQTVERRRGSVGSLLRSSLADKLGEAQLRHWGLR